MITKLKQLENYPTGDCQRTVFACLLGLNDPTEIPNFAKDCQGICSELDGKNWESNMTQWLDENNYDYIEITLKEYLASYYTLSGYCGLVGKSPRGDWNHIVIGKSYSYHKDGQKWNSLEFIHDTSPFHEDGIFLDNNNEITHVAFLVRKL